VNRHALKLAMVYGHAEALPPLHRMPLRDLWHLVMCPAGRDVIRHRWQLATTLPGDRWYDMLRMLRGEVVRTRRPGVVDMLVWTAEDEVRGRPPRFQMCVDLSRWRKV
jgi:hypothetical protein